jgi:hypothetical protein
MLELVACISDGRQLVSAGFDRECRDVISRVSTHIVVVAHIVDCSLCS